MIMAEGLSQNSVAAAADLEEMLKKTAATIGEEGYEDRGVDGATMDGPHP